MSEVIIFLLYLTSAGAIGVSCLPRYSAAAGTLFLVAWALAATGASIHSIYLYGSILIGDGFNFSFGNTVSMIGVELSLVGLIAAIRPALRGISAGLLLLGAIAVVTTGFESSATDLTVLSWQVRSHILISLMSYGLLNVGAIVAVYAMMQEKRLHAGNLSAVSSLFAPLETTEKLLFGITAIGFAGLAVSILSGLTFIDNLFAQHLAHKTAFSLLALFVFGTLLVGRFYAGWRGRRAIELYLSGFVLLCIAYFGVRVILEQVLGRSWS